MAGADHVPQVPPGALPQKGLRAPPAGAPASGTRARILPQPPPGCLAPPWAPRVGGGRGWGRGAARRPHSPRPQRLEAVMEAEASQDEGAQRGFAGRSGQSWAGKPSWKMPRGRRGGVGREENGVFVHAAPTPGCPAPPGCMGVPPASRHRSLPETLSSAGWAVWLGHEESPGTPEVASPGLWGWSQVLRPRPRAPERWGESRGVSPQGAIWNPSGAPQESGGKSGGFTGKGLFSPNTARAAGRCWHRALSWGPPWRADCTGLQGSTPAHHPLPCHPAPGT